MTRKRTRIMSKHRVMFEFENDDSYKAYAQARELKKKYPSMTLEVVTVYEDVGKNLVGEIVPFSSISRVPIEVQGV